MIPERQRLIRRHPKLIAKIAGEPGPGNRDFTCAEGQGRHAEGLERRDIEASRLQHRRAARALQRKRCDLLRLLPNRDIEPSRGIDEPGQVAFLAANPVVFRPKTKERAVVEEFPRIVAPDGVMHRADRQLGGIAQRQPVQVARRLRPADPIFHHRAKVIERRRIADCGIFHRFVVEGEGGGVSAPRTPAVEDVAGRGARMEGCAQQRYVIVKPGIDLHPRTSCKIRPAAFQPEAPEIPPPGWVPAEASQRPETGVAYCAMPGRGRRNSICSTDSSP